MKKINIKRILCPIDFSTTAAHATRYALVLAEMHEATLLLLQVSRPPSVMISDCYGISGVEFEFGGVMFGTPMAINEAPPGDPDEEGDTDEEDSKLEKLAKDLGQRHSCPIETRRRVGKPFIEIIRMAEEEEIDLIVMGTHGRTGLPHMLIGSTAEKVVRMAPCPVLTVRHPEHEFVMPLLGAKDLVATGAKHCFNN
jgi:nucleotide-binding universal stress UspA family protein